MFFSRMFLLVCSLGIIIGCTGITRPTTLPGSQADKEMLAKSQDDNLNGRSSAGLCIQTETGTYSGVRIVQIMNDTLTVIPYPFWNVESYHIHIDDIISIEVPREGDKKLKACAGGFSVGFTVVGIIGLLSSNYNDDYEAFLLLSGLAGSVVGGLGCCLGGISDMRSRSSFYFAEMTKPEKIELLNELIKHH